MQKKVCIISVVFLGICFVLACFFLIRGSLSVPTITSVKVLDDELNPLPIEDGWVKLNSKNIIEVEVKGICTRVEFYVEPVEEPADQQGTELADTTVAEPAKPSNADSYSLQRCISSRPPFRWGYFNWKNTERTSWQPDHGFKGHIWVIVYNKDIARTSNTEKFLVKAIYE
ncbi:hypothetical protein [Hydrogenoanaerobacterium sp.]|uniref:hypothetical protein n=1 Tax=Hydrogenoanaerobacterium sp. TaxID=2953763 RepID=UPI002899A3E1|nr:hypothetical protein [Hydrogenoanaerobacterium sp.]